MDPRFQRPFYTGLRQLKNCWHNRESFGTMVPTKSGSVPMTRHRALCVFLMILLATLVSAQLAVSDQAVTYQINPVHTGALNTKGLHPPLAIKWSVDLHATVSYPLIAGGKIFVLAGDSNVGSVSLYALDPQTGNILWGPVAIPEGAYWWAAAAYENGTVFVVPDATSGFSSGAIFAFDSATGKQLWTATLPGQYLYNSPPTALKGIVYTAGAGGGGTVYAVDETNGNVLWTAGVANGNNSSPVVTSTGVYVSYVCPQVYKFAPVTGSLIWHYNPGCDGGGGNTPVLFGNNLYVRDAIVFGNYNGGVFNAKNGALLSNFNSTFAPAFAAGIGLYTATNQITAFTVKNGTTLWTAAPANGDSYSSAPIIVNGVVYIGTGQGNLVGYSLTKGTQLLSIPMGAPIQAGDGDNYSAPQSGLAAAQGLLVVPASTLVVALAHK
jgi:outer membrane protein assembly factor BamB